MRPSLLLCTLLLTGALSAQSGGPERHLVQFSGVVVTGDSLQPVPFTSILTKGSYRGTMSDVYGYFSFVAQTGDTIMYAAVGFKTDHYVIPDTIAGNKYSMIHVMYPDTILLPTLTVTPWPTKEQFAQAFLNLRLSDDDYQVALKHLSPIEMMQRMENMPPDPGLSRQFSAMADNTRLYQQGMAPSTNLFNPVAWAQFVQAWKSGQFKRKR
ncbi:MAG: hypothetical protein U0U25_14795 [Flavobacteriales bacterium]